MTLLRCANHDHTSVLLDQYDQVNGSCTIPTTNPRTGTRHLRITSGNNQYVRWNIGGSPATVIIAGAIYLVNLPGTSMQLFTFREGGSDQIGIKVNASGKMVLDRNGTTVATQATTGIAAGRWYYVEFKVTISDASGVYEVRVDGINVLSGSSTDTKNTANAYTDQVQIGWGADSGITLDVDDLILMNTSGSTMNDFQGDIALATLYPTGAGATTGWTPSTGANYTTVDETPHNSGTDYNTASGVATDTYAFGNLPSPASSVKFVVPIVTAIKTDGGAATIAAVARPVSTDRLTSDLSPSAGSYTANNFPAWEVSPETSSAWTVAEVNGSEFGVKRTA